MIWYECQDTIGLPEVTQDVELLIKPEDLPFKYLSVVWDGKNLWFYSNNERSPWDTLHKTVHFKEWAYIVD